MQKVRSDLVALLSCDPDNKIHIFRLCALYYFNHTKFSARLFDIHSINNTFPYYYYRVMEKWRKSDLLPGKSSEYVRPERSAIKQRNACVCTDLFRKSGPPEHESCCSPPPPLRRDKPWRRTVGRTPAISLLLLNALLESVSLNRFAASAASSRFHINIMSISICLKKIF